jgi:hypothetical protein
LNPRSRNKKTFLRIVNNINLVGLKKPITVFRRAMDQDWTQYDLVGSPGAAMQKTASSPSQRKRPRETEPLPRPTQLLQSTSIGDEDSLKRTFA